MEAAPVPFIRKCLFIKKLSAFYLSCVINSNAKFLYILRAGFYVCHYLLYQNVAALYFQVTINLALQVFSYSFKYCEW